MLRLTNIVADCGLVDQQFGGTSLCFCSNQRSAIRQGPAGLRQALPSILAQRIGELSPLLLRLLEDLADDWRQLDRRIEAVTAEIETLA